MNRTEYKKISAEDVLFFQKTIGRNNVSVDPMVREEHGRDETEDLLYPPELVLMPQTTRHVSEIMKYCWAENISVTPRGAGTGLSGGAIPVFGGISLSVRRMNQIIDIDTRNFQVIAEPGVITEELQNAVREKGLFYPVDPASKGSCFIGGNVAQNSGGPRAVKYGVVKDYVLNLEVVLPGGEIIETGANVLKNSTGYNLTQLMVGSEGTLGVITKIVLKLLPHPKMNKLLLVPFHHATDAARAVVEIMRAGLSPSALEFMDRDSIELSLKYSDSRPFELEGYIQAHLLIEVDGNKSDEIDGEMEAIYEIVEKFPCGEMLFAASEAEKEALWKIRRTAGEAVKRHSVYKEEDTVVPRYHLPELLQFVKKLGSEFGFRSACYGHAGDGNLHVNIMKEGMADKKWKEELTVAIRQLFIRVKELGGTISGEHGIGWVQKDYMDEVFSETELNLQRGIKGVFDPKGILNPGKILPDE